jgi:hypothetical protein
MSSNLGRSDSSGTSDSDFKKPKEAVLLDDEEVQNFDEKVEEPEEEAKEVVSKLPDPNTHMGQVVE